MANESNKRIEFSPIFLNKLEKASQEIKIAFREALEAFLEDPNQLALRNYLPYWKICRHTQH
jgi:hypothetical protein